MVTQGLKDQVGWFSVKYGPDHVIQHRSLNFFRVKKASRSPMRIMRPSTYFRTLVRPFIPGFISSRGPVRGLSAYSTRFSWGPSTPFFYRRDAYLIVDFFLLVFLFISFFLFFKRDVYYVYQRGPCGGYPYGGVCRSGRRAL